MLPARSFCLTAANVFLFNPFIIVRKYSSTLHVYLTFIKSRKQPTTIQDYGFGSHADQHLVVLWMGDLTEPWMLWDKPMAPFSPMELATQNITGYSVGKKSDETWLHSRSVPFTHQSYPPVSSFHISCSIPLGKGHRYSDCQLDDAHNVHLTAAKMDVSQQSPTVLFLYPSAQMLPFV